MTLTTSDTVEMLYQLAQVEQARRNEERRLAAEVRAARRAQRVQGRSDRRAERRARRATVRPSLP